MRVIVQIVNVTFGKKVITKKIDFNYQWAKGKAKYAPIQTPCLHNIILFIVVSIFTKGLGK